MLQSLFRFFCWMAASALRYLAAINRYSSATVPRIEFVVKA